MKDSNKCESPLGGWFYDCEKTDKNGVFYARGLGKAVADVTYYNRSQGKENTFTYKMCKDCTALYSLFDPDDETEDNVVVSVEYYDKNKTNFYNYSN